MTDSRFREEWLNDRRFAPLSAEAFRLYVVANTWSASNRTDGAIRRDDLLLFPRWVDIDRIPELVTAGLWVDMGERWQIAGYAIHQTTAAALHAGDLARVADRERKAAERARERDRKAAERNSAGQSGVRSDVQPDVPRDNTGKDRTGQDENATTYQSDVRAREEPPPDPVKAQLLSDYVTCGCGEQTRNSDGRCRSCAAKRWAAQAPGFDN